MDVVSLLLARGAKDSNPSSSSSSSSRRLSTQQRVQHTIQFCSFTDELPAAFQYPKLPNRNIAQNHSYYDSLPSTTATIPPIPTLSTTNNRQWKTIRLFISSTFADMFAERDYLVKQVIPILRERCTKRKVHLIEVDLRWGITEEESQTGRTLQICLDEVDHCQIFCSMVSYLSIYLSLSFYLSIHLDNLYSFLSFSWLI